MAPPRHWMIASLRDLKWPSHITLRLYEEMLEPRTWKKSPWDKRQGMTIKMTSPQHIVFAFFFVVP